MMMMMMMVALSRHETFLWHADLSQMVLFGQQQWPRWKISASPARPHDRVLVLLGSRNGNFNRGPLECARLPAVSPKTQPLTLLQYCSWPVSYHRSMFLKPIQIQIHFGRIFSWLFVLILQFYRVFPTRMSAFKCQGTHPMIRQAGTGQYQFWIRKGKVMETRHLHAQHWSHKTLGGPQSCGIGMSFAHPTFIYSIFLTMDHILLHCSYCNNTSSSKIQDVPFASFKYILLSSTKISWKRLHVRTRLPRPEPPTHWSRQQFSAVSDQLGNSFQNGGRCAGTRFHSQRNEVSFAFYTKRWMVLHHFAACLAGVAAHELLTIVIKSRWQLPLSCVVFGTLEILTNFY